MLLPKSRSCTLPIAVLTSLLFLVKSMAKFKKKLQKTMADCQRGPSLSLSYLRYSLSGKLLGFWRLWPVLQCMFQKYNQEVKPYSFASVFCRPKTYLLPPFLGVLMAETYRLTGEGGLCSDGHKWIRVSVLPRLMPVMEQSEMISECLRDLQGMIWFH